MEDVATRGIDCVVLARNLRKHELRFERRELPECLDRARGFVLERVGDEPLAVDVELYLRHGFDGDPVENEKLRPP